MTPEAYPVLLDGLRTTLPAIRARGRFAGRNGSSSSTCSFLETGQP
jgi:hypothetical protein